MNVYIWRQFAPDYKNGLAVAIATDETKAQSLVIDRMDYGPSDWGPVEVYSLDEIAALGGTAAAVAGGQ
jgi:hypothetical protein